MSLRPHHETNHLEVDELTFSQLAMLHFRVLPCLERSRMHDHRKLYQSSPTFQLRALEVPYQKEHKVAVSRRSPEYGSSDGDDNTHDAGGRARCRHYSAIAAPAFTDLALIMIDLSTPNGDRDVTSPNPSFPFPLPFFFAFFFFVEGGGTSRLGRPRVP